MRLKYPFEVEVKPREVDFGLHWITVSLKNFSDDDLYNLDVKLNSLDSYYVWVYGSGQYVPNIESNETEIVPFQVSATGTTRVYVTASGRRNGDYFYWESPRFKLSVGREAAELRNLFVLSHPYTTIGKTIEAEAVIEGVAGGKSLDLQFWVDTPSGSFDKIADVETKVLDEGEEVKYSAEITPEEDGLYEIFAYLYDEQKMLGRKSNTILVSKV
jgi:hypothetical protein